MSIDMAINTIDKVFTIYLPSRLSRHIGGRAFTICFNNEWISVGICSYPYDCYMVWGWLFTTAHSKISGYKRAGMETRPYG
jgi:hypothetical protein